MFYLDVLKKKIRMDITLLIKTHCEVKGGFI